ncbi:MAG: hypothetical protein ABR540_00300 [Acidimicrobiales bacterium]
MIRRSIRTGFRIGVLAGIAFALFKLVQSRRSTSPLSSGTEWAAPPKRNGRSGETPLVDPHMLQGVSLKRPEAPPASAPPPTAVSDGPSRDTGLVSAAPEAPEASPPPASAEPKPAVKAAARAVKSSARSVKKASKAVRKSVAKAWVDPKGAICPSSHPVKGKLSSGIFHLRGMAAYERTTPDRCYRDEGSAAADGLRKAKR